MDADSISSFIARTFDAVEVVTSSQNQFFSYKPSAEDARKGFLPFATLVVNDESDSFSQLHRPSVFRLNIGIGKERFRTLFGDVNTVHDFTALDRIMPHPVYASASWVCVLNPSQSTFERVKPLLEEAYALAVQRHDKRGQQ
jgi:hypothetical protein